MKVLSKNVAAPDAKMICSTLVWVKLNGRS
jgi:hypothetical protein